jgi:spermidine synthase
LRVKLAIADGRNFLLASGKLYDVIISEPSNPWMKGIGNLFSLEFYKLAARRLGPNGIMCQWIQRYNLSPEDLKMVVKTFRSVFPHTTIWDTLLGDLLLIGSQQPIVLEYERLEWIYNSLSDFRGEMAGLGFRSPLALLADFVLGEEDAARYSRHARLNTDNLPLLEFSAPQSLYVETVDLNRRIMREFKEQECPPINGLPAGTFHSPKFRRYLGLAFVAKGMSDEALLQFDEALRLDPLDVDSLLERGRLRLRLGSVLKAEADFNAALQLDPGRVEAQEALAQLYRTWPRRTLG